MTGNLYSYSEYNIIKLIYEGLTSMEIAEKLCRSVYTVNTHRTNILRKAGKSKISDVIRDLKNKGLL
jgi:DNA-binding CsgD family transcriptional regulator